jgi:hypothetical protein
MKDEKNCTVQLCRLDNESYISLCFEGKLIGSKFSVKKQRN